MNKLLFYTFPPLVLFLRRHFDLVEKIFLLGLPLLFFFWDLEINHFKMWLLWVPLNLAFVLLELKQDRSFIRQILQLICFILLIYLFWPWEVSKRTLFCMYFSYLWVGYILFQLVFWKKPQFNFYYFVAWLSFMGLSAYELGV
jgi:hypothetical protein